jgi:hypothetical protein
MAKSHLPPVRHFLKTSEPNPDPTIRQGVYTTLCGRTIYVAKFVTMKARRVTCLHCLSKLAGMRIEARQVNR